MLLMLGDSLACRIVSTILATPGISPDTNVGQLFNGHKLVVDLPHDTCRDIASRLALHGLERIPVVANLQSMQLVGIVSRSDLTKPSMDLLQEQQGREKFRRMSLSARR